MAEVRIDKYLWAIRACKTRSEACKACDGGKVKLNEAPVKPAKTVRTGDLITVRKGAVLYTFKVIQPLERRVGAPQVPQYAENLTPESELEKLKAPVETFFVTRERGAGRPTKKDRRLMDEAYSTLRSLDEDEQI